MTLKESVSKYFKDYMDIDVAYDLVKRCLLDADIEFVDESNDYTYFLFGNNIKKGQKFYWVFDNIYYDAYILDHTEKCLDNGYEFMYEVFVRENDIIHCVGYVDKDCYGDYIFDDEEDARNYCRDIQKNNRVVDYV